MFTQGAIIAVLMFSSLWDSLRISVPKIRAGCLLIKWWNYVYNTTFPYQSLTRQASGYGIMISQTVKVTLL